jgi:DnaK suppressor protein
VPKPIKPSRPSKHATPRPKPVRTAPAEKPLPGMKSAQSAPFREILLRKRREMVGDVEQLEGEAFRKSRQDAAGDLSTMPIHMADLGTDNFEQDVTLNLIESEEEELREIDSALERIKSGTFGRCERCRKFIPRTRLKILPYARMCVACKQVQETE